MRLHRFATLAAVLVLAAPMAAAQTPAASPTPAEPPLLRSFFEISTTIDRAPARLEAMEIRPRGPGPFPLAVIAHGKDVGDEQRRGQTVLGMTPHATAFARRGFVTVVAMRRGYGRSQGTYAEYDGTCDATRYTEASKGAARDLAAIVASSATRPNVDRTKILIAGESVGAIAALALATLPPPGVIGVVGFSGGRGANPDKPGEVCQKDRLVDAVRGFGAQGKLPTIWLYAANDPVFPPIIATELHKAFVGGGGKAVFAMLPVATGDGHRLFSREPMHWNTPVDAFLKSLGLPTLPATAPPAVPDRLGATGQAAFLTYAASPMPFKAFANSGQGPFGWAASATSIDEARKVAADNCAKAGRPCTIVAEESWIADR